jgi:hypothetical protein
MQAIDDRNTVSDKLADLAMRFIAEQNFDKALEAIDAALSANLAPAFHICRAHALMFLDCVDEAKALYLRLRDQKIDDQTVGAALILSDFQSMRKAELVHLLTDEIQTLLTAVPTAE